ncbi:hypothetical protein [Paraburkholderia sediminicola]|uniref:hypothetical protein n=1 Tax=Paraburkholderia sediminicola TaxID=458836 RepID=UPI0038B6D22E
MKMTARKELVGICLISMLSACGGGGTTSSPASTQASQLSADQTAFQNFVLAPNQSYRTDWSLPATGAPAAGTDYFADSFAPLSVSPATGGTQKVTNSALVSIAKTLPIPASASAPTRYLVNARIVLGSGPTFITNISYQGTGVREDTLAVDGATPVQSTLRTGISVGSLTGTVATAPTDLAQWFNSLYFNPALLSTSATWTSGAAYMKYTQTEIGDVYTVADNKTATTGTSPDPTATGTTIAALMAAGGISSSSDGTTYTLSNGSVTTVNGVRTYVATAVRPNRTTPTYHTYYELNGNVYTGNLVKDGTVIGGNPYPVSAPGTTASYTTNYSQNYQIRLNAAAVSSLQGAVTF